MLVVVARRVYIFAHCIHFKHPVFVRNEEIGQLLPFAILKIKPARFMLWRQDKQLPWQTLRVTLALFSRTETHSPKEGFQSSTQDRLRNVGINP